MTAAIALARSLYPLGGVPDATLEAWYGWALRIAGPVFTGDRTQAIAHLLGHAGETWARAGGAAGTAGGGVAGPVTSSKSSTLSVTFGGGGVAGAWTPGSAADAVLMQTPGGQAYLTLRSMIAEVVVPEVF